MALPSTVQQQYELTIWHQPVSHLISQNSFSDSGSQDVSWPSASTALRSESILLCFSWPSNKTSREDDMKLGMWQTFSGVWCPWASETMSLWDHSVPWKILWLLPPCEISKLLHRAMKAETKKHFIPWKFWVGFPLSLLWNIFTGHSESWVLLKCLLEAKWMVVAICSGFVSEAFQQTVSV